VQKREIKCKAVKLKMVDRSSHKLSKIADKKSDEEISRQRNLNKAKYNP